MRLLTLIQKGGLKRIATATPATLATQESTKRRTVAPVATVAVANTKNQAVFTPVDCSGHLAFYDAQDSWEWIEERGAIMECDAGLSRDEAVHTAFMAWYCFVEGRNK